VVALNLVDPVLYRCKQSPPAPAMSALGTALNLVSYARLERFIHNVGRRALREGFQSGQVVAVVMQDQMLHALLLLGLLRIGVATISPSIARFPKGMRIDAILSDQPLFLGGGSAARVIIANPDWLEGDGRPIDERYVCHDGDQIARIIVTTGSTGQPKLLALSHRMCMRRIVRHVAAYGNSFMECSRFFVDYGITNDMFLRALIYVLSRGGLFCFPGASPMDTLQSFELHKVDCLWAAPGGLAGILKFYEENQAFRSGFRFIGTGGSILQKSLSERVRARLCSELHIHYGTTETGPIATAPAHAITEIPGATGYVLPGVIVRIVDQDGQVLPAGVEGFVQITSSTTLTEYLGDPEQTSLSFRNGFFHPGDLGWFAEDGMLVISGRETEVFNLGGEKVRPSVVEEVLSRFPHIAHAAVFTVTNSFGIDELWGAVGPRSSFDEAALKAFCEQNLEPFQRPVRYIVTDVMPLTENGKIARDQLRQMATLRSNSQARQ
jgi:acyl-coenzyme A synthetase/AMP-(fatty) acid ligase